MKIALLGNPNVGKSTLFNLLTGLHQHTGNWTGKTVSNASGKFKYNEKEYTIYDLPGTYSLVSHSKEEEVTRDFIYFEEYDIAIVVCDAVCLERNLNLVLQTLEVTKKVIVCVNLIDEAEKKKIYIDTDKLSNLLGVPVVAISARNNTGIDKLLDSLENKEFNPTELNYPEEINNAVDIIEKNLNDTIINKKWIALNLITCDDLLYNTLIKYFKIDKIIKKQILMIKEEFENIDNKIITTVVKKSEEISKEVITYIDKNYNKKDNKIDKIITSKYLGIPLMFCLLFIVFWITIKGANYPSNLLLNLFSKLGDYLSMLLSSSPIWLRGILIDGIYKVLTSVISVMLPPMAIFFPLFTILEDLGYLPRIAFNLDNIFRKCLTCGKQALTMCMGFGCNAVGVSGSRIIDSKRERLIAILTNVFVPCNGRFPTMITIITIFFIGLNNNFKNSFLSVLILTLIIILGIILTFILSKVLSKTILKGIPSSFTLELPPYRKPQVFKVIIRSIFDRTLLVLSRAIMVAAPAGAIIWLLANININNISILVHISNILNPFGKLIGLDGVILISFILGFPANEIVMPIMLMIYTSSSQIIEFDNLLSIKQLLVNNGWTIKTAICMLIFSLCHFPCSTTCLTIKKETGSWKWTLLSILLPTIVGIIICLLVNLLFLLF